MKERKILYITIGSLLIIVILLSTILFQQYNACNHQWEVVIDKNVVSGYEQLGAADIKNADTNLFKKKSITILKCIKCGRLNKTIVCNLTSSNL